MTARIAPLSPPFTTELEAGLRKWMPPGSSTPPLALFRTLARHPLLFSRMRPLGSGILGHGTLSPRTRELVILRTSARCGAEYEWGVHAAAFSALVGLDEATVRLTWTAGSAELAARDDEDALALRVTDELHDTATISDESFALARRHWTEEQILEMSAVVGFYHLIGFVVRTARTPLEPWAMPAPADRE